MLPVSGHEGALPTLCPQILLGAALLEWLRGRASSLRRGRL